MKLKSVPDKPDPEVVKLMEDLLELAKAGKLRKLVLAGITSDRRTIQAHFVKDEDIFDIIGLVEYVKSLLMGIADDYTHNE